MKEMEERLAPVTDLHCHILPQIDDGAKDAATAIEMLKMEYESGISQIVLTPHFDCERTDLISFLHKRNEKWGNFVSIPEMTKLAGLQIKLGAEVRYSPNLVHIDVRKLCAGETGFLLLELPADRMPPFFDETIYHLQSIGIKILLAHIERYSYIMNHPTILCKWVDREIFTQINASTLLKKDKRAKICRKLIDWNLVHAVASDAHSTKKRPPILMNGLHTLSKEAQKKMIANTNAVFDGQPPEISSIYCPRHILGIWY